MHKAKESFQRTAAWFRRNVLFCCVLIGLVCLAIASVTFAFMSQRAGKASQTTDAVASASSEFRQLQYAALEPDPGHQPQSQNQQPQESTPYNGSTAAPEIPPVRGVLGDTATECTVYIAAVTDELSAALNAVPQPKSVAEVLAYPAKLQAVYEGYKHDAQAKGCNLDALYQQLLGQIGLKFSRIPAFQEILRHRA